MISDNDLFSIKSMIRLAGAAIMEEYELHNQEVIVKNDNSPLTKADMRSNQIINDGLTNLEIQYPIVSEENKLMGDEDRQAIETLWIVDPLDGTKEFINRNGEFAVCIALVHKHRAVAGFVYATASDELYYAVKNQGAILEKEGTITELHAPSVDPEKEGLRIAVSRSHSSEQQEAYVSKFEKPNIIIKGSILKMTDIARSKMDIYPRFDEKTKEWDIAAGQIILEESGGKVIHRDTGKPILYNKESMQNPPFIATGKML